MYFVCPDVLCMVSENSQGMLVRFIESDKDRNIFIYLFNCIWGKKSALVQLIKYQLCNLSLSLELKKSYSRNQQSLHSRTINLCFRWPHYEQPRSHSSLTWLPASNHRGQYEHFFYWFIFHLGLKVWLCQAVALHWMLHYEYFMFPTPFRDQLNRRYFPSSAAHRVSDSKISGAKLSLLSRKVSTTDGFEPLATES